jgi:hypothetical protein
MNAVEQLDGMIESLKNKNPELPDGIHAALKAAETLKEQLNGVMIGYCDYKFEELDSNLEELATRADSITSQGHRLLSNVSDIRDSLSIIDTLPGSIASLEKAISELKQRTDGASVVANIPIDLKYNQWGIGVEHDTRDEVAKVFNDALGRACEWALMQILRQGTGFGDLALQIVENSLEKFFKPVVNQYENPCLDLSLPINTARVMMRKYFGITGC